MGVLGDQWPGLSWKKKLVLVVRSLLRGGSTRIRFQNVIKGQESDEKKSHGGGVEGLLGGGFSTHEVGI